MEDKMIGSKTPLTFEDFNKDRHDDNLKKEGRRYWVFIESGDLNDFKPEQIWSIREINVSKTEADAILMIEPSVSKAFKGYANTLARVVSYEDVNGILIDI